MKNFLASLGLTPMPSREGAERLRCMVPCSLPSLCWCAPFALVVGSISPRRHALLRQCGLPFEVCATDASEIHDGRDPVGTVVHNALAKQAASRRLRPNACLLTADTLVLFGEQLIGKPRDLDEAAHFLRAFSGRTQTVYTAVALAVRALKNRQVQRIILTRPAVEAGESLGFLPGDLEEKILPYLRPLYDALGDMLDPADVTRLTEKGVIEIAPLAYMRGRTLSNAFVVLDEAQNTTPEQMMMFLTRLGEESRMVVTGDITQIDLPRSKQSGLLEVRRILQNIPGIEFHTFSGSDVVRHPLVLKIIEAYEAYRNPIGTDDGPSEKR